MECRHSAEGSKRCSLKTCRKIGHVRAGLNCATAMRRIAVGSNYFSTVMKQAWMAFPAPLPPPDWECALFFLAPTATIFTAATSAKVARNPADPLLATSTTIPTFRSPLIPPRLSQSSRLLNTRCQQPRIVDHDHILKAPSTWALFNLLI